MKKLITVCFMLVFLVAVVAGCPNPSADSKSGGSSTTNVDGANTSTLTSSDETPDVAISLSDK